MKKNFKLSNILLLNVCSYSYILRLKKQRFLCHSCNKKFFVETSIIKKGCFISNSLKYTIAIDLKNKISEKDITNRYRVSPNTVERIRDYFKQ